MAEDLSTVLVLLDERRSNLTTQRTRLVNQLHALLRDLIPGGAPTRLSATAATRLLTAVRPAGPVETARKQLARDLVAEIRAAGQRLTLLHTEIERVVDATGSQLSEFDGIGPVITARLLGRTRRASRFPSAAAFASYAGVAPVEVASADHARHRLPRGGERQLNHAFHLVALTQIRMTDSAGRASYDRHQDRRRQDPQQSDALPQTPPRRPRLATHDPRRTHSSSGPGRTPGDDSSIQRGRLNPNHQLFGQVTSRDRHHRLYDRVLRCLTNTEEPSCGARPVDDHRAEHDQWTTIVRSTKLSGPAGDAATR